MIFLVLLIIIVILALILSVWILLVLFYTRVPFVKTPDKKIDILLKELSLTAQDTVYDLGCGDGHVLIAIEKASGAKTVGYDLSPVAYVKARFNVRNARTKTQIYFKDFKHADLFKADVIFVFLIVGVMKETWKFLQTHARPGTKIVSYGFSFPDVLPDKVVEDAVAPTSSKFFFYTI